MKAVGMTGLKSENTISHLKKKVFEMTSSKTGQLIGFGQSKGLWSLVKMPWGRYQIPIVFSVCE